MRLLNILESKLSKCLILTIMVLSLQVVNILLGYKVESVPSIKWIQFVVMIPLFILSLKWGMSIAEVMMESKWGIKILAYIVLFCHLIKMKCLIFWYEGIKVGYWNIRIFITKLKTKYLKIKISKSKK